MQLGKAEVLSTRRPRPKITVVGAGNVGATAAQYIVEKELGDVVLVDVIEGVPQGKALDLAQAGPIHRYDSALIGSNGYDESADSDIVVITAGLARKPGMTRDDLLFKNAEIVGSVVEQIVARSKSAILILVTNPLDEMVQPIVRDKRKILPCAAYLNGEYGVTGLYVGVPVKLGRAGVEQVIEIRLTPEEQAAFQKSAAAVRELVDKLKL